MSKSTKDKELEAAIAALDPKMVKAVIRFHDKMEKETIRFFKAIERRERDRRNKNDGIN